MSTLFDVDVDVLLDNALRSCWSTVENLSQVEPRAALRPAFWIYERVAELLGEWYYEIIVSATLLVPTVVIMALFQLVWAVARPAR